MPATLDAEAVNRWCRVGLRDLHQARVEIDTINVYPVPDGDTGTNLCLTMEAVVEALGVDGAGPHAEGAAASGAGDLAGTLRTIAHAALLGAQGNSGVILSQLLRGLTEELGGGVRADGEALAAALRRAADLGYAAVGSPVEGTVLTVARAAA
ncbi:MAG: DAK2 domain-containing protein, partial [Actinomycetes bacterium]